MSELADAHDLRYELLHPLSRFVRDSFDRNFDVGARQHALVDPPEASAPEQRLVLESLGSSEELFVREPVRPVLLLPVFE
ncbi:L-type lectin-domain containing receptor kinase IV.2-like [Iris pallida]|uniref:L-type lectin-domain containing receptor kinase IV.2-like n=1 Tax=Iris pallida TaxID=29817 RepID=A0AAX6GWN8_IRIPA|nr:L-type lectin-domain containing receptor kinase IV.2-like [Iris pallida]